MSEDKKRFRDTKIGGWLKDKAPDVLELVSDVTPDGGVLDAVASLIRGEEGLDPATKLEFERMYLQERQSLEENVTRRWEADTKTSYWLPNNVRPLAVACLLGAIILFAGLDSIETLAWQTPEMWTDLITTLGLAVFGAYFGGRTFEKVKKAN